MCVRSRDAIVPRLGSVVLCRWSKVKMIKDQIVSILGDARIQLEISR